MNAFEKEWAEYVRKDDIGSGFTYDEVRRAALHFHRAGMRMAAKLCGDADKSTHPADLADAILKEAGE